MLPHPTVILMSWNIWYQRVRFCPNAFTYLTLHSTGGDVNVKDDDGETPLFTVESVDVARWLVEHGASLDCRNQEGNTVRLHARSVHK